jgi:hypothetical protein
MGRGSRLRPGAGAAPFRARGFVRYPPGPAAVRYLFGKLPSSEGKYSDRRYSGVSVGHPTAGDCQLLGAYRYTIGHEPPAPVLTSPCAGPVAPVVLLWGVSQTHRGKFGLCLSHRDYFDQLQRIAVASP